MQVPPTWMSLSGRKDYKTSPRTIPSPSLRLPKVSLRTVLVVVLLAVVALYVSPRLTASWRASLTSQQASLQAQITELDAKIAEVDAALAERTVVEQSLAQAQAAVPDTPQLAQVITELEGAVASSGMTWVSGAPSPTSAPAGGEQTSGEESFGGSTSGPGRQWTVSMTVVGPASSLPFLLDSIAGLPRLVTLNSVSWQVQEPGTVSVTLDALFYAMSDTEATSEEGEFTQ